MVGSKLFSQKSFFSVTNIFDIAINAESFRKSFGLDLRRRKDHGKIHSENMEISKSLK